MKITIYGAGYVGLVTGACLAEMGNHVCCIDIDADKIKQLQQGQSPIFEPGLSSLLKRNIKAGRLEFSTVVKTGVDFGELQFIAVGTPPRADGSANLDYVLNVARSIATHMQDYRLIVDKSTVPVGTADIVQKTMMQVLKERGVEFDFDVAANPEFLREGEAIGDFMKPDRIIVGADNARALAPLRTLYATLDDTGQRFIAMDTRSAELTKYVANAYLATKISFINEVSHLAERLGADVEKVRIGLGSDTRISPKFLNPGCGYGGSCFPKDVKALVVTGLQVGLNTTLLNAVEAVNNRQKQVLFSKINAFFNHNLTGKVIALWGLAFKPNTDDMRDASSRVLMEALWARGVKVQAYDPIAAEEARRLYPDEEKLTLVDSPEAALENADALAVVTEWDVFRNPDFDEIKAKLSSPVIFDGRNLYNPQQLANLGIIHFAIGRVQPQPESVDAKDSIDVAG